MHPGTRRFDLLNTFDVVQARQCAREMARDLGFGLTDQTRIATAVSEVARRALDGRSRSSVRFAVVNSGPRRGLECICLGGEELRVPSAPGSGNIMGGVERLVDDFAVESGDGVEVAIVIRKWLEQ
jgi:serine/threonine-protein kinase RsbT